MQFVASRYTSMGIYLVSDHSLGWGSIPTNTKRQHLLGWEQLPGVRMRGKLPLAPLGGMSVLNALRVGTLCVYLIGRCKVPSTRDRTYYVCLRNVSWGSRDYLLYLRLSAQMLTVADHCHRPSRTPLIRGFPEYLRNNILYHTRSFDLSLLQ